MDNKYVCVNVDDWDIEQYINYIFTTEKYSDFSFRAEVVKDFYDAHKKLFINRLNAINYINEHGQDMERKDWDYFYENFHYDDAISIALTKNPYTPIDIVENIVKDTHLIKSQVKLASSPEKSDTLKVKYALQRELSDGLMQKICNILNDDLYLDMISNHYLSKFDLFVLSEKSEKALLDNLISQINDGSIDYHSFKDLGKKTLDSYFTETTRKNLLVDIIKKDIENPYLTEEIRSAIINNKVFDLENNEDDIKLINDFFDNGAEFSNINNFSDHMIKCISMVFFETFKICDDNKDKNIDISYQDLQTVFNRLEHFATKSVLPFEMEYDIMKRLLSKFNNAGLDSSEKRLISKILIYTKNPAVMNELKNIALSLQQVAFSSNENLTPEVAKFQKEEIFESIYKLEKGNALSSLNHTTRSILNNLCKIIPFEPKEYDYILSHKELSGISYNIALSDVTPIEVLENIPAAINKLDAYDKISTNQCAWGETLLAKFCLYCRNHNIDLKTPFAENVATYLYSLNCNIAYGILERTDERLKEQIEQINKYHFYCDFEDRELIDLIASLENPKVEIKDIIAKLNDFIKEMNLDSDELKIMKNLIVEIQTYCDTKLEFDKDRNENFKEPTFRSLKLKSQKGFKLDVSDLLKPDCYVSFKNECNNFANIMKYCCKNNLYIDYLSSSYRRYLLSKLGIDEKKGFEDLRDF